MRWTKRPRVILATAFLWLSSACPVYAFQYYDAKPSGSLGITRPTIYQQFLLDAGDRFLDVDMTLDGRPVEARADDETGLVWYTPDKPLSVGTHTVWLSVEVRHPRASEGWHYRPVVSEFSFEVKEAFDPLPGPAAEQLEVLDYINALRTKIGLNPVTWNKSLGAAALRHAEYLAANHTRGHDEEEGKALFTGKDPRDRATYFGYTGFGVAEDVHYLRDNLKAVDDWMAAPYHRFPIISPLSTECGFASYDSYQVLDCGKIAEGQKQIIVWPYDGQGNVPTSWTANENPNPLRLYPGVQPPVGYPITLQFGQYMNRVVIDTAYVKDPEGRELPLLTFSSENDDHLAQGLILIPRDPYQPKTIYTVHVEGTVEYAGGQREPFAKTWQFASEGAEVSQPQPTDRDGQQEDEDLNKDDQNGQDPGDQPTNETPITPGKDGNDGQHNHGSTDDRAPAPPVELKDITGHWAEAHIRRLVQAEVVNGYPDGTFRPESTLTRAEFIKMLATALDLTPVPDSTGPFRGIQNHWCVHHGYLGAVLKANILLPEDYPADGLDPDGRISREEIAVMITRAAGLEVPAEDPGGYHVVGDRSFTDTSEWKHPAYIMAAVQAGLITGYANEDGRSFTFRPANPATRAEAVVMVNRLLDRLGN